jgi:hypothetical protein
MKFLEVPTAGEIDVTEVTVSGLAGIVGGLQIEVVRKSKKSGLTS